MNIKIVEAKTDSDFEKFYDIVNRIYKDNEYYVHPIKKDYIKYIQGQNNDLKELPHKLLMVVSENGEVLGRLVVFIDTILNDLKGLKVGYLAEYEAIDNLEVSRTLLQAACDYLKENGIDTVKGPVSLPGGDDNRGFIIDNFERMPSIMNVYNMPYYNEQFVDFGFLKYHDVFAYRAEIKELKGRIEKLEKLLPQIQKRYGFHVDSADVKHNLKREADAVYQVIADAMPEDWEDFRPTTYEEIENVIKAITPFVDEELIIIARNDEGRPIGFALSLPDYNEILIDFKGKLGLKEKIKFLKKRHSLQRIRMFVLFVVPDYHDKGVSSAIYYKCYLNGVKKGYTVLEGSTIWDYNQRMINDIERTGAKRDITYRVYRKSI